MDFVFEQYAGFTIFLLSSSDLSLATAALRVCEVSVCGCPLTVGALLSSSSPITAALRPAAHSAALHGTLGSRLGESSQVGVVVSVVVHGRAGDGGSESGHGGVSGQQGGGGACGAHPYHGAAEDVADAVRGPRRQLAVEARVELVERVRYRVLAHWGLEVRGELVQAVVEQERPLDVGIHGLFWNSASRSQQRIQYSLGKKTSTPPTGFLRTASDSLEQG